MTSGRSGDSSGGPAGVEVTVTHPSEKVDTAEILRLVDFVLVSEGARMRYLGVVLCGHAQHIELHLKFRGNPDPTDVLAFDLGSGAGGLDGEVYVDLDTARERHAEFGVTFREEVYRYVVHGLMHLLGYRDKGRSDARRMKNRQEFLLGSFFNQTSESD